MNTSESSFASQCPIGSIGGTEPTAAILLVEDEGLVRESAAEILRVAGYRVRKAAGVVEALNIFMALPGEVGLLITDVVLPDGRGTELAGKLRAMSGSLRTILISGYPLQTAMAGVRRERELEYLAKPFSAQGLTRKVSEILARNREPSGQ